MADEFSIIDSHAHLDYPQFEGQIDEILARAQALGVTQVISIGVKLSTLEKPRYLAETYKNIWFSAGIHPHEAANEPDAFNLGAILARLIIQSAWRSVRRDWIISMIMRPGSAGKKLSCSDRRCRQTGKPIIVHARDADKDLAEILETRWRGHLQAFCTVLVLEMNWRDGL